MEKSQVYPKKIIFSVFIEKSPVGERGIYLGKS